MASPKSGQSKKKAKKNPATAEEKASYRSAWIPGRQSAVVVNCNAFVVNAQKIR
jgi:hypothetical protein